MWGWMQMIPVAANDVAFSIHAVLLTAVTLFQLVIYEVSFSESILVLYVISCVPDL